ncbi:MAG: response regulator [Bacteroidales bacterium]|nr:response regulator [Bacteroidales bacterium]
MEFLSLRTKLLILYFVLLFVVGLLLLSLYRYHYENLKTYENNIVNNAAKQEAAGNFRAKTYELVMLLHDFIITEDEALKERYQRKKDTLEAYRKLKQQQLPFSGQEVSYITSINMMLDSLDKKTLELFKLENPGSSKEAEKLMLKIDAIYEKLQQTTTTFFNHIANESEKNQEIIIESRKSLVRNFLIISITGGFLSLILAYILVNRFIAPLNTLTKITGKIAQGDFSKCPDIKTNDEVGLLSKSFEKMMDSLQKSYTSIKEHEGFLEDIISNIPSVLLIIDKNGKIIRVNQRFSEIFNVSKEEIEGNYLTDVVHKMEFPERCKVKLLKQHPFSNHECTITRTDSPKLHLNLTLTNLHYRISKIFEESRVLVIDDITEKKNYYEELVLAKEKAEQSDKMKTIFINNISHELRTPLNGILGFIDMVVHAENNEDRIEYSHQVNRSADRLINTITNYIDIAQIVSGSISLNYEKFKVKDFINEVYNEITEKYELTGVNFNLEYEAATRFPELYTDKEWLHKMLFQLVDNAVKFTPEGSVYLKYDVKNNRCEFTVEDTGVGMEDKEKIFETFYQEDMGNTREFEGSGLGLSIVKGAIEYMNGVIAVTSEKEKGTQVKVMLPGVLVGNSSPSKEYRKKVKEGDTRPVILIAEDDDLNYEYIKTILKKLNGEILRAENGKVAVEKVKENPEISLVLMDIKMPVMDGLEATKQIKAISEDIPVIAVTAHAMAGDKAKFLKAGCNDYLAKPIKKSTLLTKVKQYLNLQ